MKRRPINVKLIVASIGLAAAGVLSWAFYNLINQGLKDILALMGITNVYLQMVGIIIIGVIVLVLVGWKGVKLWRAMLKKN